MSDPDNQGHSGYRIDRVQSGVAGKCMDVKGAGVADGTAVQTWSCTKVQLWACHGGANQVWQSYNGGYRNPASGRCLDVPGSSTADGTQLVLWDCNGGSNQKWTTLTAG
ncbi:RICIN domain-containing protein [Streptomyces sp. NPDC050698]